MCDSGIDLLFFARLQILFQDQYSILFLRFLRSSLWYFRVPNGGPEQENGCSQLRGTLSTRIYCFGLLKDLMRVLGAL